MSKIKIKNSVNISNGTFPIEKNLKKKLNKRQRKIKKILKEKKCKINKNLKSKGSKENQISPIPELVIDSKLDNIDTPEPLKDSKHISSNQNSDSYSSNWKQLQQEILKKKNLQNPRILKRKHEDSQSNLDMENNNSKTITENKNSNNKPLEKKNIMNVNVVKSDVKSFEDSKNIGAEQPDILRIENSFTGVTKVVAIDCEMVGGGLNGEMDLLARVSIVNQFGNVLYNKYVKPKEHIVDYRTEFSGIRPENLVDAESFEVVQKEVSKLLSGKIVVGHGLKNDFQCLFLSHPKNMIRDTSKFKPFRNIVSRGTPSLRKLCDQILGIKIQSGEHDSIQDAQAAMRLYSLHRKEWEKEVPKINKNYRKAKKKGRN